MNEARARVEPAPPSSEPVKRHRTGLKRTKFAVPAKMPLPIKALWEGASEEERTAAHKAAVEILCAWLGKTSRAEAAARLSMPPLRFWQRSQQAVAGMVAGLLRQPRARRGRPAATASPASEDARVLRKQVERLEAELSGARSLIAILRELPAHREARESSGESPDAQRSRDRATVEPGDETRRRAPLARRRARRASADRPSASSLASDAPQLGSGGA